MGLKSEEIYSKIEARVAKIDKEHHNVHHVYKIKITVDGEVVETWILDLKGVKFYKAEGDVEAECTVTLSDDVMLELGTGKLDAEEALKADKMDVDGNLEIIRELKPYLHELHE